MRHILTVANLDGTFPAYGNARRWIESSGSHEQQVAEAELHAADHERPVRVQSWEPEGWNNDEQPSFISIVYPNGPIQRTTAHGSCVCPSSAS